MLKDLYLTFKETRIESDSSYAVDLINSANISPANLYCVIAFECREILSRFTGTKPLHEGSQSSCGQANPVGPTVPKME